jgi:hypothetical protein
MKFRTSMTRFRDAEPQPRFEEVRDVEVTAEAAAAERAQGIYVQEETPAEKFAKASYSKNGLDNGRASEEELSKMTPGERFKAASDARNRLNPHYAEDARRRRRSDQ